jgi:multicomponent Na+:H+ antiporter subunit D
VSPLLGGLVLLPLTGAVLCSALPRRVHPGVAMCTAVGTGALALATAGAVARGGTRRVAVAGWDPPLGITLVADGLSAPFLAMTAVVGVLLTGYATGSPGARGGPMFWALWLVLWASLNAVYLAGDLFNGYVALELMTVAAVGLVALAGPSALRPALRYLVVAVLGSLSYLLGVALVYGEAGTLEMAQVGGTAARTPATTTALALVVLGLALKAALFPLHGWLPPAHSGAPAAVSPVLSALVVKAAFYLAVRVWSTALPAVGTPAAAQLLGALGAAAVLWGTGVALRQQRLKLVVAYSTVAQVGYLFLVFPLGFGLDGMDAAAARDGWSGVLGLGLAHGVAKAAMFMAAGTLAIAHGTDRLDDLAGAASRMPMATLAFGLAAVSLAGLPPSAGFSGKWLALQGSLGSGQWWWAAVLLVGGVLTAAYTGRVLRVLFAGAARETGDLPTLQPVARRMEVAALCLALLAVAAGLRSLEVVRLLQSAPLPGGAA